MVRHALISLFVLLAACDHETQEQKEVRHLQLMHPPLVLIAKDDNHNAMVRDGNGTISLFKRIGIGELVCKSYDVGDTIIRRDMLPSGPSKAALDKMDL